MKKLFYLLLTILLQVSIVSGQNTFKKLTITHLTDSFYVYTTYGFANGQPFPANSMYLITEKGVVMFDTPWDSTQFQPLLDSILQRHHKQVVLCIATHFHSDRTAGLTFLRSRGIPTWSSKLTYDLCAQRNEPQAQFFFGSDTAFNVGGYLFETYYAGPGHSPDNLVIWFSRNKIIYGGCLVKSKENNSVGNIEDANLVEWPKSIRKVMKKFPNRKFVVPGHMSWANGSLEHTLKLLRIYNKNHA